MRKSKVKGQRSMSAKIVSYGTFLSTNIVQLRERQQRRHRQGKPMRSSALSIAPSARAKAFQSTNERDKRARHVVPYFPTVITFHVKHATQHLHQNCLCTLTSSYRHLANSYTLLLNASTTYTICWPGVESSYTSICLSFGNSLYVIQRWLNTYRYARIY